MDFDVKKNNIFEKHQIIFKTFLLSPFPGPHFFAFKREGVCLLYFIIKYSDYDVYRISPEFATIISQFLSIEPTILVSR